MQRLQPAGAPRVLQLKLWFASKQPYASNF
jgi:hypothetical protein